MSYREGWIDTLKSISIFLVIVLHTCNYGFNNPNYSLVIYYCGVFAIPLFFVISGYLQGARQRTYSYCLKKILRIFLVTLLWNAPLCFLSLVFKHKSREVFISSLLCFIQKGFYPQCWFLGTLIILYLILSFIPKIVNKSSLFFVVAVCFILNVINIYCANHNYPIIKDTVIQTFRLWTWLFYYILGYYMKRNNI